MKILTVKKKAVNKIPVKKGRGKDQKKRTFPVAKGNAKDPSTGEFLDKIQLVAVGLDLYGTIFFCNDHLLNVAGSRKEEVIGRNWFDLFALPSRREELRRLYLGNILLGTFPPQPAYEIQNLQGGQHLISWTCSPLRDGNERITGLFCIGIEVNLQTITPEEKEEQESGKSAPLEDQPDFDLQNSHDGASATAPPSGRDHAAGLNRPIGEAEAEKPPEFREDKPIDRSGKYLAFLLGKEEFGIGIERVKEIIGVVPIRSIPRTPGYLKGVINLRGNIIPVIDLRLKFGMETLADTPKTCIVVLEVAGAAAPFSAGIIVDSVLEVVNIRENEIADAPSFGMELDAQYILGMAKSNGKVKILLKMEQVLDTETLLAAGRADPALRSL
jgi:purine-binding chemotaxis protein CheW